MDPPSKGQELLTLQEVARRLSCSDSKVKRMIREGKFPRGLKIEGATRWPASDVDSYLHLLMRGLFQERTHVSEEQTVTTPRRTTRTRTPPDAPETAP